MYFGVSDGKIFGISCLNYEQGFKKAFITEEYEIINTFSDLDDFYDYVLAGEVLLLVDVKLIKYLLEVSVNKVEG